MGHVEIWFLFTRATDDFTKFLKMYGNFSMAIANSNSYRNKFFSDIMMIKKKRCQMKEIQSCILQFDKKTASVEFCQHAVLDWDFKSIWEPNPCMDPLEKNFYYITIYSIFCRASPFYREWPQLVTILTSFDLPFEKKFKSLKY